MEDELDFSRPENDGRNRCLSLSPYGIEYPNGEPYRCELEREHAIEHSAHGRLWDDNEERKFKKKVIPWEGLVYFFVFLLAGFVGYAIVQSNRSNPGDVPIWYYVGVSIVLAAEIVSLVGLFISERKVKK